MQTQSRSRNLKNLEVEANIAIRDPFLYIHILHHPTKNPDSKSALSFKTPSNPNCTTLANPATKIEK